MNSKNGGGWESNIPNSAAENANDLATNAHSDARRPDLAEAIRALAGLIDAEDLAAIAAELQELAARRARGNASAADGRDQESADAAVIIQR